MIIFGLIKFLQCSRNLALGHRVWCSCSICGHAQVYNFVNARFDSQNVEQVFKTRHYNYSNTIF